MKKVNERFFFAFWYFYNAVNTDEKVKILYTASDFLLSDNTLSLGYFFKGQEKIIPKPNHYMMNTHREQT
jgi:hypothetical protein